MLAEEWFSYQFAQSMMGQSSMVEKDIQGKIDDYKNKLGEAYAQYSGTDAKGKKLMAEIFPLLSLGPMPDQTDSTTTPSQTTDQDPQVKLNAMPGTPKEKSRIAKALNAMAGQKILTESPSFYTRMERAAAIAASKDIDEVDEQSLKGRPVESTLKEAEKKSGTSKPDRPRGRKDLDPPAGIIPGESKEPTVESKPASALQEEKNLEKAQNQSQNEDDIKFLSRNQSQSEIEIETLDRILPKTEAEKASIRELNSLLNQNNKKFNKVQSLDKAIGEAIIKFKKEDIEPSVTQIISEVLNLETLLQLSPISFVSELQKAMNPTASRSKLPSNNDIEDMATEARERVETVKERLRLRLAEIDREIKSLEKSPAAQTSQTDLQDRMTEQIADAIKPSAKKYLSKEQVKTKVATQFIGEGVKDSSTDRYHKMYQSEGVANTGKYNSSDIIYVSSNGARGNRVNPVVDGELQGKFKNIDKAIKAGAAFIMDTYDHLVKTRKYNIGELALGNYVKSKGYKRWSLGYVDKMEGSPASSPRPKPKAESLKPGAEGEVSNLLKRLVESYLNFVAPEERRSIG